MLKFIKNVKLNSSSALLVVLARSFLFESCTKREFNVTDEFKKTQ